jgi:dienelactone hydrolase
MTELAQPHLHWPYRDLLSYATPAGPAPVRNAADWEIRRAQAERALLSLLGPFPVRRCALEPATIAEERHGSLVRRTVEYSVDPGDRVRAFLTFPAGVAEPLPVVLALHGTCAGGKDFCWDLPAYPDMQTARLLPAEGFAVLAPDGPTMGDRVGPHQAVFDTAPFYEQYPGWSILGKYAWEAMRAVDYLETVDFVDSTRVGALGHSLGGHWTIMAAAFDERIRAAVSSCGFIPFRSDTNHAPGNKPSRWARDTSFLYLPALGPYYRNDEPPPCDWHEILALIAPRPFLNVSGWHDDCFQDAAGIPECCDLTAGVYDLLGAADRFQCFMFDGPHDHFETDLIHGWMKRWLQD